MSANQSERLRDAFLGWQCRIREYAIRRADGRPSAGMRPSITVGTRQSVAEITTVLCKREPEDATVEFQYIVKRTHDPRLRFEAAIKKLQVTYYQKPKSFSDGLTGLFSPDSSLAAGLIAARQCELIFAQANQRFQIPVEVSSLAADDPFYAATFWHNAMFNPRLAAESQILQFIPDWSKASADPTPLI